MTGTKKLALKIPAPQPVLAARCCCPEFVPNWCCRGDVYFRRVTELVKERQSEEAPLAMSGRNI